MSDSEDEGKTFEVITFSDTFPAEKVKKLFRTWWTKNDEYISNYMVEFLKKNFENPDKAYIAGFLFDSRGQIACELRQNTVLEFLANVDKLMDPSMHLMLWGLNEKAEEYIASNGTIFSTINLVDWKPPPKKSITDEEENLIPYPYNNFGLERIEDVDTVWNSEEPLDIEILRQCLNSKTNIWDPKVDIPRQNPPQENNAVIDLSETFDNVTVTISTIQNKSTPKPNENLDSWRKNMQIALQK